MEAPAVTLPDKPSALLLLALDELASREKDPRVQIDMRSWVFGKNGVCRACLAGLGFLRILGIEPSPERSFSLLAEEVMDCIPEMSPEDARVFSEKVASLNDLRTGDCFETFRWYGIDRDEAERFNRDVTRYEDDPAAFKAELRQLAADLAAAGF